MWGTDGLLAQPNARTPATTVGIDKFNARSFKCAPNSVDICGAAATRPWCPFHATDGWQGQASFARQIRLRPIDKRSGSSNLSGGQHCVIFL